MVTIEALGGSAAGFSSSSVEFVFAFAGAEMFTQTLFDEGRNKVLLRVFGILDGVLLL